jgi:hypothetical protein
MADAFQFVAGGAVQASGGVYLERDADRDLLRRCLDGDFTYILTSRQMGKSSLMYRVAERLVDAGARPVIIDLTELGAQTTADQWFKGFLLLVQEQLDLHENASAWWDAHAQHAYAHRLIRYLREVALVERKERLVLFVDEIDTTLRLGFTDDFFAAIRFLYQTRAMDRELQRISFVLIGVATPNDLIKDAARTPFNIGHRIDLTDFSKHEAAALADHLSVPPDVRNDLIYWILRWTRGHPYLTMRVLRSLAEDPPKSWTADEVDGRLHDLFLGPAGETDTNLQFVRDMLTNKAANREEVLKAYDSIRSGARVPDREHDQITSWLKLSGIVRREGDLLKVRNPIYEKVFDENWTKVHRALNVNWKRRLAVALRAFVWVAVIIPLGFAVYAWQQKGAAETARAQADAQRAIAVAARQEVEGQRDAANRQLELTKSSLAAADKAVEELKRFDPEAAAKLTTQLASTQAAADKEVATLRAEREKLVADRDGARTQVQKLTQENARLTQENTTLRQNPARGSQQQAAPQGRSVSVPNVIGRQAGEGERILGSAGFLTTTRFVDSDQTRGQVVDQLPDAGTQLASGATVSLSLSSGPPPALTRGAQDETQQILRVLQRYKSAYESLDAKAVAAINPSIDVARLQTAFSQFSQMSYDLLVHVDGVSIDGSTATVTATETIRPTSRSVRANPTTTTAVFTMRRSGTSWVIQSVSNRR